MPKKEKVKCLVCKGEGVIDPPGLTIQSRIRRRTNIARTLRAEGYTIREIMVLMNYKSTNSVAVLLKGDS